MTAPRGTQTGIGARCGTVYFSCVCGLPAGRHRLHKCGSCGARWEHAPRRASDAASKPSTPLADRRRRLNADIKDARRALRAAQAYLDRLRDESAALAHEEQETRP